MNPRFPPIDVDPNPAFPVYSAGNFGEVAPDRISPVSWSLVGTPMERATRRLVRRCWGERSWAQGGHYVFVGYFACKPYHNLSAYTRLASRLPMVSPEDVTAAYFEGTRPPRLGKAREGGLRQAAALPRLIRELTRLGPSLLRLEEEVADLEMLARTAVSLRSEAGMVEVLTRAAPILDDAWDAHIVAATGLVPLAVVQRRVNGLMVPHAETVTPWLNRPGELVWDRLHAFTGDLAPGEFLGTSFYEVAEGREPWSRFAVRRGTGPGSEPGGGPGTDPVVDPAEAAIGMLSRRRRHPVGALARIMAEMMASREHSKSLVMRTLHVHRRVLPELARHWSLDDTEWPYLTIEELRRVHLAPGLADRAADRAAACAEAVGTPMPDRLDFSGGAGPVRPGAARARGVSPGRVTGVVVHPPADDVPEDGSAILVCESADADAAPLLGLVGGVVTGRGSAMSHIAILAREHRLPAVVGHPDVSALRPGDLITIDGTTGEVHVESAFAG
ncbi:PEP-utilizing enzyme [Actinomadura rifamycini]|uniref:PEP-utilizing enzyme n=1 Tax=Actinomadura rifamycini TaxID=31962 RepID=UPI00040811BA|nr:PEP-utilizing enzyme [Actinomadura rifamycini]